MKIENKIKIVLSFFISSNLSEKLNIKNINDKSKIFNNEIDEPETIDRGISAIKKKYVLLICLLYTLINFTDI